MQHQVTESTDWDELLNKVSSGPPLYSPFKLLDPVANMGEMFIHHEDVRRAQTGWEPSKLDDTTVKALARGLPLMARLTLGGAPARVSLRTPDGKTVAAVGRGPELTVTGEISELTLFIAGRASRSATPAAACEASDRLVLRRQPRRGGGDGAVDGVGQRNGGLSSVNSR